MSTAARILRRPEVFSYTVEHTIRLAGEPDKIESIVGLLRQEFSSVIEKVEDTTLHLNSKFNGPTGTSYAQKIERFLEAQGIAFTLGKDATRPAAYNEVADLITLAP